MPEDHDPQDDEQDDGQPVTLSAADIKALRAAAKKGGRADALERELAFARAGIDTDNLAHRWFAKGYDGKLDKESLVAAAKEAGIIKVEAPAAAPEATQDFDPSTLRPGDIDPRTGAVVLEPGEANLTEERKTLVARATPDTGQNPDPYTEAIRMGEEHLAKGGKASESLAVAMGRIARAAHEGDSRVFYDPEKR